MVGQTGLAFNMARYGAPWLAASGAQSAKSSIPTSAAKKRRYTRIRVKPTKSGSVRETT